MFTKLNPVEFANKQLFNRVNTKRNFLFILVFLVFLLGPKQVFSSITDGTIDSVYKYVWGENIGWLNFGCSSCNVRITDSGLTGYVWSENYGWINLAPLTGGVKNDEKGNLSGYAWGENLGWINFKGVIINSSGEFTGMAFGDISGQINFDCNNCKVKTDWRPKGVKDKVEIPKIIKEIPTIIKEIPEIIKPLQPSEKIKSPEIPIKEKPKTIEAKAKRQWIEIIDWRIVFFPLLLILIITLLFYKFVFKKK